MMLSKINICPIIKDHFNTLRVPRTGKLLYRDLIGFLVIPLFVAIPLVMFLPSPPSSFLTLSITVHTLFIPLLVNILFVIYGIQEKHDKMNSSKERALLHELYKNICYAVLVSFASVALTAFAHVYLGTIGAQCSEKSMFSLTSLIFMLIYYLIAHLFLTVLMIVRRTHTLLSAEFKD